MKFFQWAKQHLFVIVLLGIILYLLFGRFGVSPLGGKSRMALPASGGGFGDMMTEGSLPSVGIVPDIRTAPPTSQQDRLVIRDTSLSLVVKDVPKVIRDIEQAGAALGGYLVDSHLSIPEGAASGTITVRVPAEKRGEALEKFKSLSVKTVSESVMGTDVTDEYVDLEARLDVLNKTKAKFESILAQASRVQELLEVQRELVNLQQQIDSIKGQQKFLTQSAKLTKITVYLSTDELALPFTPDQPWRPSVIFKQAVRSLVSTVRSVGTLLIWGAVYAPLWVPLLLVIWWVKKRKRT